MCLFDLFCFGFEYLLSCATLLREQLTEQLLYPPWKAEPHFKWFMLLLVFGSSGTITCQNLIHSVGAGRIEASSESLRIFTSLFPSWLRPTIGDSSVSSSHNVVGDSTWLSDSKFSQPTEA